MATYAPYVSTAYSLASLAFNNGVGYFAGSATAQGYATDATTGALLWEAVDKRGGTTAERDTGLGFYVDDIEAACAAVASSGGRVVKRPEERPGEGITLATAVDTEGNRFSIAEPTPR